MTTQVKRIPRDRHHVVPATVDLWAVDQIMDELLGYERPVQDTGTQLEEELEEVAVP